MWVFALSLLGGCSSLTQVSGPLADCPALERYERKLITRPDGSLLTCFVSVPVGNAPMPLVFFCQGGGYASMFEEKPLGGYQDSCGWLWEECANSHRIRFAFVEKRNVAFGSPYKDPAEHDLPTDFHYYDTLKYRLEDIALALEELAQDPLIDLRRVALVGHGEGACVAAAAAVRHPERVTHLGFLARGGLSRLGEMALVKRQELTRKAKTEEEVEAGMNDFFREIEAAFNDPFDLKSIHFGFTPSHITSYWLNDPLEDLLQLDIPIFVVVGGNDPHVPPASADLIRLSFLVHEKNNLTYKVYPGLDHGFTGPDPLDPKAGEVFQLPRVVDRFLDWYLGGRFIAPPETGS